MGEIELGAAAEATIQAYKELASDPGKRLALALDRTCIQFLAYVIAEGEGSLVQSAIETLSLIAEAKECRPSLANTFGVLESLQSVTEDEESYSKELRDQAAGLFTSLQFARHIKKSKSSEETTAAAGTSSGATSSGHVPNQSDTVDSSSDKTEKVDSAPKSKDYSEGPPIKTESVTKGDKKPRFSEEKKDSFLGPHNTKAKVVTLFIKGMVHPEQRKLVEEELVRVRGLISIVFDLGHSRVTCRVKRDLSVEKLAAAVARTETLSAQQVTTNSDGEEEIILLGGTPKEIISPVEDLPDYLPEEDAPVDDATSAMAPSGTFMETATSWFSTASNLLQKSFYW
ncbi:armadillo repeat-containing protein 1-like isoform X2 [Homarus americanus]|uniref:armadillo repeat-containing protein 1-like isoform X2 n=1 Tax=Homarus americanus TaxID=6706 RepID=UPI001C484135|nr:armadillo repeat-containing protein 1-like isoform X2 [Homarus americanus]